MSLPEAGKPVDVLSTETIIGLITSQAGLEVKFQSAVRQAIWSGMLRLRTIQIAEAPWGRASSRTDPEP